MIIDFVWALFHPTFWIMNSPYSPEWDRQLKLLMEEHTFEYIDRFTARIGDETVWISNYPYAAFAPYSPKEMRIRPSRRTIKKAHAKMIRDVLLSYGKEDAR